MAKDAPSGMPHERRFQAMSPRRRADSGASRAHAPNVDFGDARHSPEPYGARGEAAHGAALGAQEVRVVAFVGLVGPLEAPHVVPDVAASRQADIDQIDEVAVDGGAIEAAVGDPLAYLRVAQGAVRSEEHAQDPDPRRGGA